ncbi:hypothetical protein Bbelb_426760 [Branchiostoma belcheri]|nr:hypothetical protein Bbelb_426760 [Branchiostoma belcheri]
MAVSIYRRVVNPAEQQELSCTLGQVVPVVVIQEEKQDMKLLPTQQRALCLPWTVLFTRLEPSFAVLLGVDVIFSLSDASNMPPRGTICCRGTFATERRFPRSNKTASNRRVKRTSD